MGTPPGSYDNLDALDAATAPADGATADGASAPAPASNPLIQPQFATGPQVTYRTQLIDPPTSLYIYLDDRFFISVRNSDPTVNSIILALRLLTPQGVIQVSQLITPPLPSDRSLNSFEFQLEEGFLLSACAYSGSTVGTRGRTYIEVILSRGGSGCQLTLAELIADYVTNGYTPSWPAATKAPPMSGKGWTHSVVGALPAAGAEIVETVPANAHWRPKSIRFSLTTSATVTNRDTQLQLVDAGGNVVYSGGSVTHQTAGITNGFSASNVQPSVYLVGDFQLPLPVDVELEAGMVWRTHTTGLQAGDQYTAPVYLVEEWLN